MDNRVKVFPESDLEISITNLQDVRPYASGGMSLIYKAFQKNLERTVAVKQLKKELRSNIEIVARFRREARTLASVLHHNIAAIYDFVDDPSNPYIVMEYIEGVDLSFIIQKLGQLPEDIAVSIAVGIARGLHHIHSRALVHRDIKPANIRINPRGVVKLMDFGIALDTQDAQLTRPGVLVGSPQHLSPEQIIGNPVTSRADQFLFGICLYEMVTGVKPFKDGSGETVFQKIREGKFVSPSKLNPSISPELNEVILRCLSTAPEERYRNMVHVIAALENILGEFKSHHAEELILAHLSREALIDGDIQMPVASTTSFSNSRGLKKMALMTIAMIGFFALGFFLAKQIDLDRRMTPQQYQAPHNLK